ncbi:MAG: hypothetical protein WBQ68_10120, partial [Terriglobales bacterium]
MFNDQDVAGARFLILESAEEQAGDGVAGLDLGVQGERDDVEFGWGLVLSPLWGFVVGVRIPTAYAVGYILAPLRGFSFGIGPPTACAVGFILLPRRGL